MVLADHVHRDGATGKFFLLGTYTTILVKAYPCLCQDLVVYATLTDGHGNVPLRLVLTDADEERGALGSAEGLVPMGDPTRLCEVVFQLKGVMLPSPGLYRLQLHSGQHLLRELRLLARELSVPA
jgi:hypothetical protein